MKSGGAAPMGAGRRQPLSTSGPRSYSGRSAECAKLTPPKPLVVVASSSLSSIDDVKPSGTATRPAWGSTRQAPTRQGVQAQGASGIGLASAILRHHGAQPARPTSGSRPQRPAEQGGTDESKGEAVLSAERLALGDSGRIEAADGMLSHHEERWPGAVVSDARESCEGSQANPTDGQALDKLSVYNKHGVAVPSQDVLEVPPAASLTAALSPNMPLGPSLTVRSSSLQTATGKDGTRRPVNPWKASKPVEQPWAETMSSLQSSALNRSSVRVENMAFPGLEEAITLLSKQERGEDHRNAKRDGMPKRDQRNDFSTDESQRLRHDSGRHEFGGHDLGLQGRKRYGSARPGVDRPSAPVAASHTEEGLFASRPLNPLTAIRPLARDLPSRRVGSRTRISEEAPPPPPPDGFLANVHSCHVSVDHRTTASDVAHQGDVPLERQSGSPSSASAHVQPSQDAKQQHQEAWRRIPSFSTAPIPPPPPPPPKSGDGPPGHRATRSLSRQTQVDATPPPPPSGGSQPFQQRWHGAALQQSAVLKIMEEKEREEEERMRLQNDASRRKLEELDQRLKKRDEGAHASSPSSPTISSSFAHPPVSLPAVPSPAVPSPAVPSPPVPDTLPSFDKRVSASIRQKSEVEEESSAILKALPPEAPHVPLKLLLNIPQEATISVVTAEAPPELPDVDAETIKKPVTWRLRHIESLSNESVPPDLMFTREDANEDSPVLGGTESPYMEEQMEEQLEDTVPSMTLESRRDSHGFVEDSRPFGGMSLAKGYDDYQVRWVEHMGYKSHWSGALFGASQPNEVTSANGDNVMEQRDVSPLRSTVAASNRGVTSSSSTTARDDFADLAGSITDGMATLLSDHVEAPPRLQDPSVASREHLGVPRPAPSAAPQFTEPANRTIDERPSRQQHRTREPLKRDFNKMWRSSETTSEPGTRNAASCLIENVASMAAASSSPDLTGLGRQVARLNSYGDREVAGSYARSDGNVTADDSKRPSQPPITDLGTFGTVYEDDMSTIPGLSGTRRSSRGGASSGSLVHVNSHQTSHGLSRETHQQRYHCSLNALHGMSEGMNSARSSGGYPDSPCSLGQGHTGPGGPSMNSNVIFAAPHPNHHPSLRHFDGQKLSQQFSQHYVSQQQASPYVFNPLFAPPMPLGHSAFQAAAPLGVAGLHAPNAPSPMLSSISGEHGVSAMPGGPQLGPTPYSQLNLSPSRQPFVAAATPYGSLLPSMAGLPYGQNAFDRHPMRHGADGGVDPEIAEIWKRRRSFGMGERSSAVGPQDSGVQRSLQLPECQLPTHPHSHPSCAGFLSGHAGSERRLATLSAYSALHCSGSPRCIAATRRRCEDFPDVEAQSASVLQEGALRDGVDGAKRMPKTESNGSKSAPTSLSHLLPPDVPPPNPPVSRVENQFPNALVDEFTYPRLVRDLGPPSICWFLNSTPAEGETGPLGIRYGATPALMPPNHLATAGALPAAAYSPYLPCDSADHRRSSNTPSVVVFLNGLRPPTPAHSEPRDTASPHPPFLGDPSDPLHAKDLPLRCTNHYAPCSVMDPCSVYHTADLPTIAFHGSGAGQNATQSSGGSHCCGTSQDRRSGSGR